MSSLFDFATIINEPEDGRRFYTVARTKQWPVSGLQKDIILPEEQYRPDKIAHRLYNDYLMSWVIDDCNGFYHLKDYIIGREFFYPTEEILGIMELR